MKVLLFPNLIHAEEIGSVDSRFHMYGHNSHITIEAFNDPDLK
ncbi:CreA family protein [Candidatus Ishikawella capsulata]|nr:hypothetical protein [Candidatus Ishikawaella capsulata]